MIILAFVLNIVVNPNIYCHISHRHCRFSENLQFISYTNYTYRMHLPYSVNQLLAKQWSRQPIFRFLRWNEFMPKIFIQNSWQFVDVLFSKSAIIQRFSLRIKLWGVHCHWWEFLLTSVIMARSTLCPVDSWHRWHRPKYLSLVGFCYIFMI